MDLWPYERLKAYLLGMERPPSERENHRIWVEGNLPRFIRTLELVPPGGPEQRCLEIGSIPYTFTLLMKKFRQYDLTLVDFFSGAGREHIETVRVPEFDESHEFHSHLYDVEHETLPFSDASFDGVLCGEVLEHLTTDPVAMLSEIHRVLKPDGWFIITTPNVANLTNVLDLLHGRNVYRPYEPVFGPTWRHNREYTTWEVGDLLAGTGFAVDRVFAEDSYPPEHHEPLSQRLLKRVLGVLYKQNYGFQLYALARRGPQFRWYYPPWLSVHIEFYVLVRRAYVRVGENDAVQLGDGWGATEVTDSGRPVRWLAGPSGIAYLRTDAPRTRLAFDIFQRAPRPLRLHAAVAPHSDSAGSEAREVELPLTAAAWQTCTLPVDLDRAEAIRVTLRLGDQHAAADAIALSEIRWQ